MDVKTLRPGRASLPAVETPWDSQPLTLQVFGTARAAPSSRQQPTKALAPGNTSSLIMTYLCLGGKTNPRSCGYTKHISPQKPIKFFIIDEKE